MCRNTRRTPGMRARWLLLTAKVAVVQGRASRVTRGGTTLESHFSDLCVGRAR